MPINIFLELSLIIIIAIVIIAITRILKQPMIISYIITGIIISPPLLNLIKSTELIFTLSEIGIALLLFMVGISLNPKVIKEVGKVSLITGIGQVIFTAVIGYFIGVWLGFNQITSIYLAIALTFSSTIIIAKLLSDKGDLDKLYGKVAIGFLIVQDLIAILALMIVSSLSDGQSFTNFAFTTFATGTLIVIALFIIGYFALPKITKSIAKSQEFLLLFSLGWCFTVAALFDLLNFSIEIGAILAGITLSFSPYRYEISSKLKPLRDFFIFLFFIWLGSQLSFQSLSQYTTAVIIFSLFILIGNPLILMTLMGILKYKKRTSFLTGLVVAQISEFSHILIALGIKVGHIAQDTLSLITVIGLITIAGSTYFIIYGDKIYSAISPLLTIFERKSAIKEKEEKKKKFDVILFGAHRTGHDILEAFKNKKQSILIIDHNPEVVEKLTKNGFNCIYGDIADIDLFEEIDICNSKMLISTVPDKEINLIFMHRIKLCHPKAIILVVANDANEALELYKNSATYVITPKFIGGHEIAEKIKSYHFDIKKFLSEKISHIKHLYKLKNERI